MQTNCPVQKAQPNCDADKGGVPMVLAGDGGQAQEHEDGRLAALGQHFDKILDRLIGIMAQIALHILPHHYATGHNS
jgi:hypothetical protein